MSTALGDGGRIAYLSVAAKRPSKLCTVWVSFLCHSTPVDAYPINEDDVALVHVRCGPSPSSKLRSQ